MKPIKAQFKPYGVAAYYPPDMLPAGQACLFEWFGEFRGVLEESPDAVLDDGTLKEQFGFETLADLEAFQERAIAYVSNLPAQRGYRHVNFFVNVPIECDRGWRTKGISCTVGVGVTLVNDWHDHPFDKFYSLN